MGKGRDIIERVEHYFKEQRKLRPNVTDDMLYDEGSDQKIYYMNGNDGTYFDWFTNDRVCEFFMFFKSTEMGFIKVFLDNEGYITGYLYEENYKYGDEPVLLPNKYIGKDDAIYLAALLLKEADGRGIYDKPIDQIDFDAEPSCYHIEEMKSEQEDEYFDEYYDEYDDDDEDDEWC